MLQDSGPGWKVSADIHREMLLALYIRDLAAIESVGAPALAPLSPKVKPAAARELAAESAGELRQEWQSWWESILRQGEVSLEINQEPDFTRFSDSPSLQHLLRAHYGNAFIWTQNRMGEYKEHCRRNTAERSALFSQLFFEHELAGAAAEDVQLNIVELPLAEPRAWFVEPNTVLISQELVNDADLFRSYLQPIIGMIK